MERSDNKKNTKNTKNTKTPCPTCGGSGQISFFQGESRFLLTDEECPACSGLGYILEEDDNLKKSENKKT